MGGSKQVLRHRVVRALGQRHVYKGVCIRSNPMRIETTHEGVVERVQISDEDQLTSMSHYVVGFHIPIAPTTAADVGEPRSTNETAFAAFYKSLGAHYLPTVCDGDCGFVFAQNDLRITCSRAAQCRIRVRSCVAVAS